MRFMQRIHRLEQKRTYLKNLIVIGMIISQLNCAAALKSVVISEPMVVTDDESPVPDGFLLGLQEIDPENPPMEGLWTSWNDATAMANFLRSERIKTDTKIAFALRDRDIANHNAGVLKMQLDDANSPSKRWWMTWGFPIGLGIGTILGVIVPVAIQGASK